MFLIRSGCEGQEAMQIEKDAKTKGGLTKKLTLWAQNYSVRFVLLKTKKAMFKKTVTVKTCQPKASTDLDKKVYPKTFIYFNKSYLLFVHTL